MTRAGNRPFDRRRFLAAGSAFAGAFALGARGARAADGSKAHRTLVLVELTGGNDGLSTVVPHGDDDYHRSRPNLRLNRGEVLAIDERLGLHPSLSGFHRLYHDGQLAIVEGAGYPHPARSHFRSLEVWHGADTRGRAVGSGWIGRLCDATWTEDRTSELVVHIGPRVPFSLASNLHPPVALESPTAYQWFGEEEELAAYREACMLEEQGASGRDAMLARLRDVHVRANASSERIRAAVAAHVPKVDYPRDRFAATLRDIAAIVHAELGSRVLSTNLATFDTHADQKDTHAGLLRKLDQGLSAFLADLAQSEAGRETLVLVYSEFGRRVAENASRGTDHGKAGPVFVLGARARGGLHGKAPRLDTLDDGDVAFTTDFRSVYATLIERWFGASAAGVLGADYPLLELV